MNSCSNCLQFFDTLVGQQEGHPACKNWGMVEMGNG